MFDIIKIADYESSKKSSQAINKQYPKENIKERELRLRKRRLKHALTQKGKYQTETQENIILRKQKERSSKAQGCKAENEETRASRLSTV